MPNRVNHCAYPHSGVGRYLHSITVFGTMAQIMNRAARICLFMFAMLSVVHVTAEDVAATNAATVANLRYATSTDGRRFEISGQVLTGEDVFQLLKDDTGHAFVSIALLPRNERPHIGDIVRVRGHFRRDDFGQNDPMVEDVKVIAHRPLPPAVAVEDFDLSQNQYRHLTVSGVVVSAKSDELDKRYNWILLKSSGGSMHAAALNSSLPLETLQEALDAEVSLTGFSIPHSSWRRNLGMHLFLDNANAMRIIAPAPSNPFAAPELADVRTLHRQSVSGTVVAATSDRFYISNGRHGFLPVRLASGGKIPKPGDNVHVVGFAETDPFHLQLVNALVRIDSTGPAIRECARPVRPEQLFSNAKGHPSDPSGHGDFDVSLHGKILSIRGTLRYFPREPQKAGVVDLVCAGHTISINISAIPVDFEKAFPSGSLLEVSGLCLAEFENPLSAAHLPTFSRFTLVPRDIDDMKIIKRAPWWTPVRLKWLTISLLAVLVGILTWTIALRRLSERRGRELSREQLRSAEAKVKVEERTRLAVELHDSISQTLTGVAFQVDSAISSNAGKDKTVERFLLVSRQMLASCRKELQCCLWDLRSRTFEEKDMTDAVLRSLSPYMRNAKLSVRFDAPRELLSETTTHTILKIIRELVVNAIRHGHAQHISIEGKYLNGTVWFSVKDDGTGFDVERADGPSNGHFGIHGIRERIRPLRGTLSISSSPGSGTEVTVSLDAIERNGHEA